MSLYIPLCHTHCDSSAFQSRTTSSSRLRGDGTRWSDPSLATAPLCPTRTQKWGSQGACTNTPPHTRALCAASRCGTGQVEAGGLLRSPPLPEHRQRTELSKASRSAVTTVPSERLLGAVLLSNMYFTLRTPTGRSSVQLHKSTTVL